MSEVKSKWVNVNDKLPDTSDAVVVTYYHVTKPNKDYLGLACFSCGKWYWWNRTNNKKVTKGVKIIQWMPIEEQDFDATELYFKLYFSGRTAWNLYFNLVGRKYASFDM